MGERTRGVRDSEGPAPTTLVFYDTSCGGINTIFVGYFVAFYDVVNATNTPSHASRNESGATTINFPPPMDGMASIDTIDQSINLSTIDTIDASIDSPSHDKLYRSSIDDKMINR